MYVANLLIFNRKFPFQNGSWYKMLAQKNLIPFKYFFLIQTKNEKLRQMIFFKKKMSNKSLLKRNKSTIYRAFKVKIFFFCFIVSQIFSELFPIF